LNDCSSEQFCKAINRNVKHGATQRQQAKGSQARVTQSRAFNHPPKSSDRFFRAVAAAGATE